MGGHGSAKPALALLLTAIVPGAGQLWMGRRSVLWRAVFCVSIVLWLAVGILVTIVLVAPPVALTIATDSRALIGVAVAFILAAVIATAAIVHLALVLVRTRQPLAGTDRADAPTGLGTTGRVAICALATALVVTMVSAQGYAATLSFAQQRLISTVFAGGDGLAPIDGRYNILLAGFDTSPGRATIRPDSIHVASIEISTGAITLIGISRDTRRFPVPEGSGLEKGFLGDDFCDNGCQLNIAYTYGDEHPELYPGARDPGIAALNEAVTGYTGLAISGYVAVDMQGFASLVDALGGVTVRVNTPVLRAGVPDEGKSEPVVLGPPIEAGVQRMDGETALWFARSRLDTSNQDRMLRQACLAEAAFTQLDPLAVLAAVNTLADADTAAFATDIPRAALAELAELGMRSRQQPLRMLDLNEPLVTPVKPDVEFVMHVVDEVLAGHPTPDRPGVLGGAAVVDESPQSNETVAPAAPPVDSSEGPCSVPPA